MSKIIKNVIYYCVMIFIFMGYYKYDFSFNKDKI